MGGVQCNYRVRLNCCIVRTYSIIAVDASIVFITFVVFIELVAVMVFMRFCINCICCIEESC